MSTSSRRAFYLAILISALATGGPLASAQSTGPAFFPESTFRAVQVPAPLTAEERTLLEPLARLRPATFGAADQLVALRAWNDVGRLPTRNGFSRPLAVPHEVALGDSSVEQFESGVYAGGALRAIGSEKLIWSGRVEVANSYRLRLHLNDVTLPASARLWVIGSDGETVGPFGAELISPAGDLWTPSVAGPAITLEVVTRRANERLRFSVDKVMEIFPVGEELARISHQE